ncbi:hypothetical protein FRC04_004259 [Tulasnella sp. 424]|nr:hypothetical protein FRC04_004259 [Tulasnella sp. 424]KAG8979383.1 hypothetical protein FRC05_008368 [Tulasnella sp. 425]
MESNSMIGLDHLGIQVPYDTFDTFIKTYLAVLAPLGVKEMYRIGGGDKPTVVGMGVPNKPFLWFYQAAKDQTIDPRPVHVAITADTRAQINEFHNLATVEERLKCNGPPGLRGHYHPSYYAAYVLDPLGNNLEVVTHCPVA